MSNNLEIVTTPSRQVLINEQSLRDTAYAIRERENRPVKLKPSQFSKEIFSQIYNVIGGDRTEEIDLSVEENDVNFYDYDGTRVYSYSKEEFLGLSSLPANPSHDNLIAQGWNWSLSDAKNYVQNYGILDVGQMYDAKTSASTYGSLEIDIELKEGYLTPTLSVDVIDNSTGQQYYVNWGDGQTASLPVNTINLSHTYSTPGKYTIRVSTVYSRGNAFSITGTSSGSSLLTGGGTNDDIYRNCITDVRVGSCVKELGDFAFQGCKSLRTITLHKDCWLGKIRNTQTFTDCYSLKTLVLPLNTHNDTVSDYFVNCYSLKRVIFPSNVSTLLGGNNFYNCKSLSSIFLSQNISFIDPMTAYAGDNCFKNCSSLKRIVIPETTTELGNYLFQDCYSLKRIDMYTTTPLVANSNTFTGLPAYTKIYVPWSRDHSILNAYKAATYWSAIADQIYQMPMNENIQIYETYAVFDSADGSLKFFRDDAGKYSNGDTDGTKTYYTGIETTNYNYADRTDIPWYSNRASVTSVTFEDEIRPISTACWFYGMNNASFTSITNLDKLDTSNVTNLECMFWNCEYLTDLDVSNFNTSNVTDMSCMFYNCKSLTSLDVSHFDTSNVTTMNSMFHSCKSLTSLDLSRFNTSNVTTMQSMFYSCNSLISLDVSHFDTSNVTDMSWMFFAGLFSSAHALTNIDLSHFNTSKVTNMQYMFGDCKSLTSLDVSHFDTSNVTNTQSMFSGCQSLTNLDVSHFNTSNVTNMNRMFDNCNSLTSLDVSHFNTNNVTDMSYMFYDCSKIKATFNVAKMPTSYTFMCYLAATASGSQITLKYISPVTSADIDTLVATKSSSSNVINGGQGTFVSPTPPTPPTPVGGAS